MKFSLHRFLLALTLCGFGLVESACVDRNAHTDRALRGQVEVIYSDLCIDCEDEVTDRMIETALVVSRDGAIASSARPLREFEIGSRRPAE